MEDVKPKFQEKFHSIEILEDNKDWVGWNGDHWYYILEKHLSKFYPCPENMIEGIFKSIPY